MKIPRALGIGLQHAQLLKHRAGLHSHAALHATQARTGAWLARAPFPLFLRELVHQPSAMGAICASSSQLARHMASCADRVSLSGWVVELGAGTGVITAALLAAGIQPERLVVVEQSERLAAFLRYRFPEIHVLQGDAADLPTLLASIGPVVPHCVERIVSGLPLLSMPSHLRTSVLQSGAHVLAIHGLLVQFTYALGPGPSPWEDAGLTRLRSTRILWNLPPARVDVLVHAESRPNLV